MSRSELAAGKKKQLVVGIEFYLFDISVTSARFSKTTTHTHTQTILTINLTVLFDILLYNIKQRLQQEQYIKNLNIININVY